MPKIWKKVLVSKIHCFDACFKISFSQDLIYILILLYLLQNKSCQSLVLNQTAPLGQSCKATTTW